MSALERLALEGGSPVRTTPLPYARPHLDQQDRDAVLAVLDSDYLTTGPRVEEFEERFAASVGARFAVAFSSGTAALHGAAFAAGLGPGADAAVACLSFVASANCALYEGARASFADVAPDTLAATAGTLERAIGPSTRALIPVDYCGHPLDHGPILELARRRGLVVIEDACHAPGAVSKDGRKVGSIADLTCFSFHPVKPIVNGEGGMVTVADEALRARLKLFRNHGIATTPRDRQRKGEHRYDQVALGYNYRLSDIHCALGTSQLARADERRRSREAIAARFTEAFAGLPLRPVLPLPGTTSAWHLYVVQLELERLTCDRDAVFRALHAEGVLANVHYLPIHLHTYHRAALGTGPGLCPVAEAAYERLLSLPLFSRMGEQDVDDVIAAVTKVLRRFERAP